VVSAHQGGGAGVSLPLVAMATGPNGPANDEAATGLAQPGWVSCWASFANWVPRPTASLATRSRSGRSEKARAATPVVPSHGTWPGEYLADLRRTRSAETTSSYPSH